MEDMLKWMMMASAAFSVALNAEIKVLAFAGSARDGSVNQKLVTEAAKIARQMNAQVTEVKLKDYAMPFYDEDLETGQGMPAKVKQFRQLMVDSDVIMIASPEYNGSLSALLKNTIDWASRGQDGGGSREAFQGKKFVIMSASPGPGGGSRGLVHLRTILENIGGTVVSQQVVVPDAYTAFNEQGQLKNEKVKKELQQAIRAAL